MRPECIKAVTEAIGRPLTQAEIQGIEDRLRRNMQQLAQTDPAWQSKSTSDRFMDGAAKSAEELIHEQHLKKRRVALTILAHDRIASYMKKFPGRPLEGLDRMLAFSADGKSGIQSIESASNAIRDESLSRMLDVIDQTKGKFMGLFQDEAGNLALVRELHGQDSGSATAKAAAKQFKDVAEHLRQRFNRAGGDIGLLEDWSMPRDHSQARVAKDQGKWVNDHITWANREKYLKEDGSRMNDQELTDFLNHAWVTLATGGVNKLEPGRASGNGMRANRGSESRQIHYKDAESFIAAQQAYGDRSLLELLTGHIDKAARDIALVEALGPNPNNQVRYFLDSGMKSTVEADPRSFDKTLQHRRKIERLYEEVAGTRPPPVSAALANGFDTYRALNVASRLGSAVITSITDEGTIALTAAVNGMPIMKVFANEIRQLNPLDAADRRQAQRAGLGLNQLMGTLTRWGADGLGSTEQISGRVAKFSQTAASKVMQASGLTALTSGRQRAFGVVMLDTIGDMTRRFERLADLEASDRKRLSGQGITDTDWAVWRLAEPEDWRGSGDTVLTANSIYKIDDAALAGLAESNRTTPQRLRDQAATRLLGSVLDETNMAVIEPGARERSIAKGGSERGTWKGELTRSFFQFKSFSIAMLMRHIGRGMAQEGGWGKARYIAALVASTTVMGGMAIQLSEIASGRDPKDITDDGKWGVPGLRFGLASFLKGGALGLYGDFLFSDTSQGGGSPLASIGGPIAGDLEQIFKLKDNAADGEVNQTGAKLIRLAKSHLPAANLWYTKAAVDHMIFNQLQEHFSPGYLARMRARARTEFKQSYWWDPQASAPERGPNLGAALGDN